MRPGHCYQVKRIMLRSRGRHCHWYLEFKNSISTYVYGRKFTLITDHQPLTTILGSEQGIPTITAARMQRWGLYSLHIIRTLNSSRQSHMQTLTVCHAYLSLVIQQ